MSEVPHGKARATWDAGLYESEHGFVWKFGADLVQLLNPQPAERILDMSRSTGASAIVMATQGRTGIDLQRFGSVARRVLEGT